MSSMGLERNVMTQLSLECAQSVSAFCRCSEVLLMLLGYSDSPLLSRILKLKKIIIEQNTDFGIEFEIDHKNF